MHNSRFGKCLITKYFWEFASLFTRHGEEGCTILVFVLRRIGSHSGARRCPLTGGWIVWDSLEASCCAIGERDGAILQCSGIGKHDRRNKLYGGSWALVSSIATRIASCTFAHPERGCMPFLACFPAQRRSALVTFKLLKLTSEPEAKCWEKGRIFFLYFICPLVCISLCGGTSKLDLIDLTFHCYPVLNYYHCKYLIYFH